MPSRRTARFHRVREVVAPAADYASAIAVMLGLVTAYALALQWLLGPATA